MDPKQIEDLVKQLLQNQADKCAARLEDNYWKMLSWTTWASQ